MLFQKKKEKMSYCSYWERMLGYNYDTEFAIYIFLCDRKIKRKYLKKVSANKQFNTYFEWENHVKSLCCNAPLSELNEFYKYLNHKSRSTDNHSNLNINILNPIMITIFSVVLTPIMYGITNNYDNLNNLISSDTFVKNVLVVMMCLARLYLLMGTIIWMVGFTSKAFVNTKQEEFYYADYLKILNEIIEEKEK